METFSFVLTVMALVSGLALIEFLQHYIAVIAERRNAPDLSRPPAHTVITTGGNVVRLNDYRR